MKKELLLSTALAGAGLVLFTGPALAGSAEASKLDLTIGGSLDFQAGIGDDDTNTRNTRGYDFVTDTEIHFDFRGTTDNGLTYGARIETEADQGGTNNVDEGNIYLFGDFGRIELGDQDGAEDRMIYDGGGTQSGVGGIDGDVDRWFANTANSVTSFPDIIDSGDNTKITYFTPRIAGFQAGASFTPDLASEGTNVANDGDGSFENHIGIGGNYVNSFNGVDVAVGAVYSHADDDAAAGAAVDDISAFAVGFNVGFSGFTLGGSYGDDGDSRGTDDRRFYNIGAGYGMGPWSVSVGYIFAEGKADAAGSPDEEFQTIAVSAGYSVAPGLYAYADLLFADSDDGTAVAPGNDNTATILLLGTVVKF